MSASMNPGTAVPLLRHRAGRRSRMTDLRRFLAANPGSDPLMGNYTLVELQDIVLNFQGMSEQYEMLALTAGLSGSPPTQQPYLLETGQVIQGDNLAGKHLAMTTGVFRGGGLASIASVYDDGGQLVLHVATNSDATVSRSGGDANSLEVVASKTIASVSGPTTVRVRSGHLIDGPHESFVIAWADDAQVVHLQGWITDAQLLPTASGAIVSIPIADGGFDLAVGDLDQDGRDEVVVLWPGVADSDGNRPLNAAVVALGGAPTAGPPQPTVVGTVGSACQYAVATGSFHSSPATDQVAIAWGNSENSANVVVYQQLNGQLVVCGSPFVDTAYPLTGSMLVRLGVGDVDLDGYDELILATVGERLGQGDLAILRILAADDALNLTLLSVGAVGRPDMAFAQVDLAVAYGNLGDSGSPALVVAALGAAGLEPVAGISELNIGLVQLSPGGELPPALVEGVGCLTGALTFKAQDPNLDLTLSMALGDFNGQSIRVGPPTQFTFDQVNSILAIVNAPPTQTGVNAGLGASLTFTSSDQQQTSFNYTVNDGWTASDELGVNMSTGLGQLSHSMNTTYGQNFSNSSGSTQTYAQSVTNRLTTDDLIVLSGTSYDVWEYPVQASSTGPSPGCILVVFPNVAGPETFSLAAASPSTDYAPDHVPGTLLSYSSELPADWAPEVAVSKPFVIDVNDISQNIVYNSAQNSTQNQTQTQNSTTTISNGVNFSRSFNFFGGLGIGLQARFSNNYTSSTMSNYSITYTASTSITVDYEKVPDPSQEYQVCPYVYFSTDGGFLVVDYEVTVPETGYWLSTFNAPSPQFNKPWANSTDASLRDLTRSISFVEQSDGSLTITARVANYGLVEAREVTVSFYLGDPALPGAVLLGRPPAIAAIAARARENVSINWQPSPDRPGPPVVKPPYTVFATIEPGDGSEFAPGRGYAVWPSSSWTG